MGELKLAAPPRVVRPVKWRRAAEHVEIFDSKRQAWFRYHAWTADVLEGVEQGRALGEHVARLVTPQRTRADAEKMLRNFFFELRQAGNLDLGFPAPPRSFAGDRYRVERELGRGAVGVAWLCRDEKDARLVVKQPWDYFADLARAQEFLRREADLIRGLDHARIVRLLDEFPQDGCYHLARSFVDGEPLPLGKGDAALARGLAELFAAMHARGRLLLDAHPGNFLLAREGPALIDVGLGARVGADGVARLEAAYGGRGFVAPEVRLAKAATVRTDVWGFGRLLFALERGVLPQQWSEAQLAQRGASEIVLACCRDEPALRPADMGAVVAMLG